MAQDPPEVLGQVVLQPWRVGARSAALVDARPELGHEFVDVRLPCAVLALLHDWRW
jgi:hypothetical protein